MCKFYELEVKTIAENIEYENLKYKIETEYEKLNESQYNISDKTDKKEEEVEVELKAKNQILSRFIFLYEKYTDTEEETLQEGSKIKKLETYKQFKKNYIDPFRIVEKIIKIGNNNQENLCDIFDKQEYKETIKNIEDKIKNINQGDNQEWKYYEIHIAINILRYSYKINSSNKNLHEKIIEIAKEKDENNTNYHDGCLLSYLIQYYEKLLNDDKEDKKNEINDIENKIQEYEKEINVNINNQYFLHYKLAYFFYLKSKYDLKKLEQELSNDDRKKLASEMQKTIEIAKKYQEKAIIQYKKYGKHSSSFKEKFTYYVSNNNIENNPNETLERYFSISNFSSCKRKKDLKRISRLFHQIREILFTLKGEIATTVVKNTEEKFNTTIEEKLKNTEEKFQQKTTETMTQIISVLAIFSTIIGFLLAEVQVFKYIDTLQKTVIFTLSLASALGFFTLCIYALLSRYHSGFYPKFKEENKEDKTKTWEKLKNWFFTRDWLVIFFLFLYFITTIYFVFFLLQKEDIKLLNYQEQNSKQLEENTNNTVEIKNIIND